ncbi:hypothetical protein SKAU_G00299250 [Synaphobranchus kaupii]|uniref:Nuclear body protein SP140-like protein n=1 Tax=Synaphobranchus kaupii TaxID=118154 RepID=A0A9Q1IM52_SYNKA|nr:hypothetical protein SKAU_G00299250 [Synaphobranchus kaupii]
MDPLDFLTEAELLRFFHCKKTEMSCIEQPHTFLNQLRDHNLVPEDRYKKVVRMRTKQQKEKGVYQVLDWLETERPHWIKLFWSAVFKDHILQLYPVLRLLRNNLLDGSFHFSGDLPDEEDKSAEQKGEEKEKKMTEGKKSEKKGGKKRSESVEEEEEEEEEPGPSTQSTPSKRKKPQKPSYSSPIRKGVKEDIWNWPLFKAGLPVTCGDKEGSLHRDKLARGEKCIRAEGRWFTPQAFEDFGGKKRNKDWKRNIHCQKTPLQKLIQEGTLKSPNLRSRRSLTRQRKQDSCPEGSSDSERSALSSEKRRTTLLHTRQSEHNIFELNTDFEEEGEEEEEENKEEEEEKSEEEEVNGNGDVGRQDDVAMSQFPDARLSVTCGSATGTLQKDRFASGTSGKCIRTASRWLTPVEFAREDPTLANSFWKKSILCQGIPLNDLIERKVLVFHSLLCVCKNCSKNDRDQEEQKNDDDCSVCSLRGSLLCCDQCPRAFHSGCHLPTVDETMLGEQWLCTHCILTESQHWRYACDRSLTQALENRISDFMLQCQHLLLQLYNSDEQHIFSKNPLCHGESHCLPLKEQPSI